MHTIFHNYTTCAHIIQFMLPHFNNFDTFIKSAKKLPAKKREAVCVYFILPFVVHTLRKSHSVLYFNFRAVIKNCRA